MAGPQGLVAGAVRPWSRMYCSSAKKKAVELGGDDHFLSFFVCHFYQKHHSEKDLASFSFVDEFWGFACGFHCVSAMWDTWTRHLVDVEM